MRSLAASSSTGGHLTPRDPHDRSSHYRYSATEDEGAAKRGAEGGESTMWKDRQHDSSNSEAYAERDEADADEENGDEDNNSNNDDMNACVRWLRGFDFSTVNPFEFSPDFDAESVFAAQRFRRVAKTLSDQGLPDDVIVHLLSKTTARPTSDTMDRTTTERDDHQELLNDATQKCAAEMAASKGSILERTWLGLFYNDTAVGDQYRLFSMRTVMPLTVSLMYNVGNLTMGPTETLTGRLLPYRYFWSGASLLVLAIDMCLHFVYVPATKQIARIRMVMTYFMAVIAIGITSWFLYYVHLYCDEMVDVMSYIDDRHPLEAPGAPLDCVRQMDAISMSGPTMCILALCMHPIPTFIFCVIFVIATMIPRAFIDTPPEKEEHWQLILAKVIIYVALVTGAVMQSYFRNRQWQRAFEETVNVRRKQDQAAKDNDEIEGLICTLVPAAVLPRLMALGTTVANNAAVKMIELEIGGADGEIALSPSTSDAIQPPPGCEPHSFDKRSEKHGDATALAATVTQSAVSGVALERMFSSLEYDKSVDRARCATVLFADMKGFTQWSSTKSARDVATMLNTVVCEIDSLAYQHDGVEKIKTVGDAYWAVTGLPEEFPGHADVMLRFAFDMTRCIDELNVVHPEWDGIYWRTAVHSGPLSGAILGTRQTSYEVFGRTLMVCQKVEAAGIPGRVCCTDSTLEALSEESPLMAFMEHYDSSKAAVRSLIDEKLSRSSKVPAGAHKGLPSTRQSALSSATSNMTSNLTTSVLQLPGVISNPELDEHMVEFVDFCAVEPSQTRVYAAAASSDADGQTSGTPEVSPITGKDSLAKRRVLVQRTKVPIFTFVPFDAVNGRRSDSVSQSGSRNPSSDGPQGLQSVSTTPVHSASDDEALPHSAYATAVLQRPHTTSDAGADRTENLRLPGFVADSGRSSELPQFDPRATQRSSASASPTHLSFDMTNRSVVPGIAGDDHLLPVPVHVSARDSASGSVEVRSLSSTSALAHSTAARSTPRSTSARSTRTRESVVSGSVSDTLNTNNTRHPSGTFQSHHHGATSLLLGRRISKNSTRKESSATRGSKSTKGAHISVSVDDQNSRSRNASQYKPRRGLGKKASSSSSAKQTKAERKKAMEEKQRAVKDFIRQRVAMHKATLASAQKVAATTSPRDNKHKQTTHHQGQAPEQHSKAHQQSTASKLQSSSFQKAPPAASPATSTRSASLPGSPFVSQPISPAEQRSIQPHHEVDGASAAHSISLEGNSSTPTQPQLAHDTTVEHFLEATVTHMPEDSANTPPADHSAKDGNQEDADSEADLDEEQRQERRITKTKYRLLIQCFKDDEVEFRYGIFAAQAVLQTMKGAGVGAILLFVCVVASFRIQDHPCVSVPGLVLNGVAILLSIGAMVITSIPIGRNPILRPLFAVSPTVYGARNSGSGITSSTHEQEQRQQQQHSDVYDADKISPSYVMLCPFFLLLVAFTCSLVGTSLSSRDNCFIGIDRALVPVFGAGTLSPLVGLLPWYQMLVLIVLFVAGPGVGLSWFSIVRFNSTMVVIQGGVCMIGFVMYILEKFLRLQFSEKEMGKLMERRLYELREGREAVLATVVPRHVIPDLFKWFAHDMAPEHAVARSFDRIVVGFIQLCEPPSKVSETVPPSLLQLPTSDARRGSRLDIGNIDLDIEVEEEEAELAEPDDQSWMLRLHAEVDHLIGRHTHISKIKTVGDIVMIAGPFFDNGQNTATTSDADLCRAVSDVRSLIRVLAFRAPGFRAGVHVGPVFGACQGSSRLSFDIFGDSVNVASRVMTGQPRGSSAVSHEVRQVLLGSPDDAVRVWAETQLGDAVVRTAKGKGEITTHEIKEL